MKYEMIFGDEKLFDGAPEEATHATKGGGFYKIENMSAKYASDGIFNGIDVLSVGGYLIAERRIIKEPKRWTWEDKKAGRLPEVGCRAIWHDDNGMKYTVKIETAFFGNECAVSIDDEAIYFAEKFCLFPIETPAEKAQREENEFVTSLCKELDGTSLQHDSIYERGVRAAYRKLKGGE